MCRLNEIQGYLYDRRIEGVFVKIEYGHLLKVVSDWREEELVTVQKDTRDELRAGAKVYEPEEGLLNSQEEEPDVAQKTGSSEDISNESPKSIEELEEIVARKTKEAEENYERLLRLGADFDNYKKRIEREKTTLLEYAEENIMRALLPTIDNLDRAITQGQTGNNLSALLEGVEMTYKGLVGTLLKFGLKSMESIGQPFNPHFHEAMAMEASKEVEANRVLREYEKGYLYKERLVRPAKVVVSKGDD